MLINFLTIFPEIFNSYLNESILKRAQQKKLVKFNIVNIRDFAEDKHHTTDDSPYGGGAGMVMKIQPIFNALKSLTVIARSLQACPRGGGGGNPTKNRTILLSAKGRLFTQKDAARLSKYKSLTFICGHYEGVDERVKKFVDEEISIGEYVLTGGELPAMVIADAVARLVPGVIRRESLMEESHSGQIPKLEYPQYTRPEIFEYKAEPRSEGRRPSTTGESGKNKKLAVPAVLLSGDHKKIKKWREKNQNG